MSDRSDPKTGPFVNLNQTYCSGLDALAKGYEPVLKSVGRWNLEVFSLMTRRARACLEFPARVGQCKTPQDLIGEQLKFWQAAALDYSEGAQRLTAAFGDIAAPGLNGVWSGAMVAPVRDYINFPEAKPLAEETAKRRAA